MEPAHVTRRGTRRKRHECLSGVLTPSQTAALGCWTVRRWGGRFGFPESREAATAMADSQLTGHSRSRDGRGRHPVPAVYRAGPAGRAMSASRRNRFSVRAGQRHPATRPTTRSFLYRGPSHAALRRRPIRPIRSRARLWISKSPIAHSRQNPSWPARATPTN